VSCTNLLNCGRRIQQSHRKECRNYIQRPSRKQNAATYLCLRCHLGMLCHLGMKRKEHRRCRTPSALPRRSFKGDGLARQGLRKPLYSQTTLRNQVENLDDSALQVILYDPLACLIEKHKLDHELERVSDAAQSNSAGMILLRLKPKDSLRPLRPKLLRASVCHPKRPC